MLIKRSSRRALLTNFRHELRRGKKMKVAWAIAYGTQRAARARGK